MPLRVSYILAYSAYVGSGPENSFKQLALNQLEGMLVALKNKNKTENKQKKP